MLRKRIIAVVVGLALFAAVTGVGIAADSAGVSMTSSAYACQSGGSSGGGC